MSAGALSSAVDVDATVGGGSISSVGGEPLISKEREEMNHPDLYAICCQPLLIFYYFIDMFHQLPSHSSYSCDAEERIQAHLTQN